MVVFDAKYKAHLANVDGEAWRTFTEQERAAHRADVHQVLAYAALFDADAVTSVLAYPLRPDTWAGVAERRRDLLIADVGSGGRAVRVALAGLPFGWSGTEGTVRAAWAGLTVG